MRPQPITNDSGYVTRGEFRQFELRMDDRFDGLGRKLDALHATVSGIVEEDDQAEWLGPRSWATLRIVAPAAVGGLIAWLVAHFT